MNRETIEGLFQTLRMHLRVTRRLVNQFPEAKTHFRPVPEVRSAAELAGHIFTLLTECTDMVLQGKHAPLEPPVFKTKQELLDYMDAQVETGYANLARITDTQVAADLNAFGMTFPGWKILAAAYDETLHHRGQLTVYLRLLGIEPVSIYDLEGAA